MKDIHPNSFANWPVRTLLSLIVVAITIPAIGDILPAPTPHATTAALTTIPPVDLVDERPSTIGKVWDYSTQAIGWVWNGLYTNVFSWVTPSPSNLSQSLSKQDTIQLFKLLGYAGYKLKVIDTDVGIIPGISMKFGQVRELSEADLEYLDTKLSEWEKSGPGMYDGLQRRIIKTLVTMNANSDYRVSSLEVKLLPLPDVGFTMIPRKVFLGEEGSTIMRAIQRVERNVRTLGKEQSK